MTPPDFATDAASAIVNDLLDRRGLRETWRAIDPFVREEIAREWARIIRDAAARGVR